ncbi:MAG: hypothetical protein MSJ26_05570 [Oscillospiraceae bacterium]|nr:hypothetical protein [Oscillospiraceae bacterium]
MKKLMSLFFEKVLLTAGVLWSGFCLLGLAASAAKEEHHDNIPFIIVCLGLGIAMILSAKRRGKLRNRAEVYAMCLADKPNSELAEIARTMNIPLEQTVRELEELIDKDYLNNIYIDRAEGRVKILSEEKGGLRLINGYRFVTCKSCGASNRITGSSEGKRCSYCKAPLTENTEINN